MYESRSQEKPIFDAKGTETVRRDGTPALRRIEKECLQKFFEDPDLSKLKAKLLNEWTKIMAEDVSIKDFCFAKEVKLGAYKENGTLPPGAMIATKMMAEDENAEPMYKERIPYVVVAGAIDSRLVDRSVTPEELINNHDLILDSDYYILRHLIPPLERIFSLAGANIRLWYNEMARIRKSTHGALRHFLKSTMCQVCGGRDAENGLCFDCSHRKENSALIIGERQRKHDVLSQKLNEVCRNCSDLPGGLEIECISHDCHIYYERKRLGENGVSMPQALS